MKIDPICIVGFMGCGKTTVARALAKLLKFNVKDLDTVVEEKEGMTIREIVAQKGMPYFREVEAATLKEMLSESDLVIATGGGAFVEVPNRRLMLDNSLVVWPYVPFAECMKRLAKPGEITKRPLMAEKKRDIEKRFNDRLPAYRESHIILSGVGTPAQIARSILRNRFKFL